jgi:hypothetical protein
VTPVPERWTRVELEPGVSFSVPPEARKAEGTPVDSNAGLFDGDGYRITYDLGRFGERLDQLTDEERFESRARRVAGRAAREVAFAPGDEPFAWARIVQVDAPGGRTLTVRVSCDTVERCELADALFDSIIVSDGGSNRRGPSRTDRRC